LDAGGLIGGIALELDRAAGKDVVVGAREETFDWLMGLTHDIPPQIERYPWYRNEA